MPKSRLIAVTSVIAAVSATVWWLTQGWSAVVTFTYVFGAVTITGVFIKAARVQRMAGPFSPLLFQAPAHQGGNKESLLLSDLVGCSACLSIFSPREKHIRYPSHEYDEDEDGDPTGFCPFCDEPRLIGSASGLPITRGFIEAVHKSRAAPVSELLEAFLVSGAIAALAVIGLNFFTDRIDRRLEGRSQRLEWPTVQGRVVSTEASVTPIDYTRDISVRVDFTYEVDKQTYSGSQTWSESDLGGVSLGFGLPGEKEIEARFPPGTLLPVYNNPSDPNEAIIKRGGGWPIWWLVLAVLSGLIAVLAMWTMMAQLLQATDPMPRQDDQ